MAEAKEAETTYNDSKHVAKYTVCLATPEAEKQEFATVSPNGDGVFRIAKQMGRTNQDVIGKNCVCSDAGELLLTEDNKMKVWVEHYARLLNVEFECPSSEEGVELVIKLAEAVFSCGMIPVNWEETHPEFL